MSSWGLSWRRMLLYKNSLASWNGNTSSLWWKVPQSPRLKVSYCGSGRYMAVTFLLSVILCSCALIEAQIEVEELKREIEGLREKVQKYAAGTPQVRGGRTSELCLPASLMTNIISLTLLLGWFALCLCTRCRSLVATNECLLAELTGSGEHWSI